MSKSNWADTVAWIASHEPTGGVTWEEACAHFGITRAGWRQRIKEVRRVVGLHPDLGYVLPRPTKDNGWRYRVTNVMYEVGKADIRSGHIDDNIHLLGILRRMEIEAMSAYDRVVDEEPAGKRSKKAKELFKRFGALAIVIDAIESDQGGLSAYAAL